MASAAAPYGARPIGTLSASGSWSGKVREYPIASGTAVNIFYGDFVKALVTGYVTKDVGTSLVAGAVLGIFVGCSYTDPSTSQPTHNNMWPTGTVASDAVAYVIDDPDVIFQMQSDATLTVAAGLFANVDIALTSGSTAVGVSKNALDGGNIATTTSLPIKIIGFVDAPGSAVGDDYTDAICKFNDALLFHRSAAGLS